MVQNNICYLHGKISDVHLTLSACVRSSAGERGEENDELFYSLAV